MKIQIVTLNTFRLRLIHNHHCICKNGIQRGLDRKVMTVGDGRRPEDLVEDTDTLTPLNRLEH